MPAQEPEYRVVYPDAVKSLLRTYVGKLLDAGWDKQAVASLLKTMDDRLKRTPLEFGEPLYNLHAAKLRVAVGFVRPFAVNFGMREESRVVFVGKLVLMTTDEP